MTNQSLLDKYIGKVLSGKGFKLLFPELSNNLIKLTNLRENHNGFQFIKGINIDNINFDPTDDCKPGGIYFTEISKLCMWLKYNGQCMKYCRKVILMDDSKVYIERDKFKADKMILEDRIDISDLNEWVWLDKDYCLKAVNQYDNVLKYIKDPIEAIKLAVYKKWYILCHTKNLSKGFPLIAPLLDSCKTEYIIYSLTY